MGGGRAENPKLLIMAWSFWWPAPIQEHTQCWLIQTRDTQKLQGFLEPCVKNWGQRPTPEQEMLHVFLGNYMGLGSCVLGLGGRDQYIFFLLSQSSRASQVALVVKNSPDNAGDLRDEGSIPGSGRFPREGKGNPLQYSCPENPMDRGAWRATVHRVAKSETWLKRQH